LLKYKLTEIFEFNIINFAEGKKIEKQLHSEKKEIKMGGILANMNLSLVDVLEKSI
jgi:hypothetical protein